MSARDGSPYLWRGFWLWPVDGYYDVHLDEDGSPDPQPFAELLTLADARALILSERRYESLRRLGGLSSP